MLDRRRAVIVGCVLGGLLLTTALVSNGLPSLNGASPDGGRGRGEELSAGAVLFVSPQGNQCLQRMIDNATLRIRDHGTVDCDAALAERGGSTPNRWAPQRVDVIREGFAKRPQ